MKDGHAFSGIKLTDPAPAGRDQRLFTSPAGPAAPVVQTTKQRANATTFARDNAPTPAPAPAPASEATHARATEPALGRNNVAAQEPALVPAELPANMRAEERRVERHSHDIFIDQVRWMNRLKLELGEDFGVKLTSNALVQLAIDMLRRDFEANGERSELFRTLIREPQATVAQEGAR